MAINQQEYFEKALRTIESCQTIDQLKTAERVMNHYDDLECFFTADEYDHEIHTYKLLAAFNKKEKELL